MRVLGLQWYCFLEYIEIFQKLYKSCSYKSRAYKKIDLEQFCYRPKTSGLGHRVINNRNSMRAQLRFYPSESARRSAKQSPSKLKCPPPGKRSQSNVKLGRNIATAWDARFFIATNNYIARKKW